MTVEEKDRYIEKYLMKLKPDTLRFMVVDLMAEIERIKKIEADAIVIAKNSN